MIRFGLLLGVFYGYWVSAYALDSIRQWVVVDDPQQKMVFYQNDAKSIFLYGMELTFLGDGFEYSYRVKELLPLKIKQNQTFGLTSKSLYMLAKLVVTPSDIEHLDGIRLRWISTNDQYLVFRQGGVEDEIDSHLSIHCHPSVEICDFDHVYLSHK